MECRSLSTSMWTLIDGISNHDELPTGGLQRKVYRLVLDDFQSRSRDRQLGMQHPNNQHDLY